MRRWAEEVTTTSAPAPVEVNPFAAPVANPFAAPVHNPFAAPVAFVNPFAANPFGGGAGGGGGKGGNPFAANPFAEEPGGEGFGAQPFGPPTRQRQRITVFRPKKVKLPGRYTLWGMPAWQYFEHYAEMDWSEFSELVFPTDHIDGLETDDLWLDREEAEHCLSVTPLTHYQDMWEANAAVADGCFSWWDDAVADAVAVWDHLLPATLMDIAAVCPTEMRHEGARWAGIPAKRWPDDFQLEDWSYLIQENDNFRAAFMDVIIWVGSHAALNAPEWWEPVNEILEDELSCIAEWQHLGMRLQEEMENCWVPNRPHQFFAFEQLHPYEPAFEEPALAGHYYLAGRYECQRIEYISALDHHTRSCTAFEPGVVGYRTDWFTPVDRPAGWGH